LIRERMARHFDPVLVAGALALAGYGGLLIYSASLSSYPDGISGFGHPVVKQALLAVLGIGLMLLLMVTDYRLFGRAAPALYGLGVLALVAVLFVGDESLGSRRWLTFGPVQVQASELAKPFTILALARYMADRPLDMRRLRHFLATLVMGLVPAVLVMLEPDMGTAIIFGSIWLVMALMGGARPRYVGLLVAVLVLSIPVVAAAALSDYQRERLALFFNPNLDPLGGGFNILQAEIGIGSGGLFGKGLFQGSQTQLDFLQTATTDYIFSVLGEELGLAGALLLLALYVLVIFRCLRAASLSYDLFGRLLATGIAVMLLVQVFINVGVNVRLLPVTGIPLPFISQGGSSLVMTFMAMGLVESVLLRRRPFEP
jgi:rod shape determining protein RodA